MHNLPKNLASAHMMEEQAKNVFIVIQNPLLAVFSTLATNAGIPATTSIHFSWHLSTVYTLQWDLSISDK
jgi:hypothetical protein